MAGRIYGNCPAARSDKPLYDAERGGALSSITNELERLAAEGLRPAAISPGVGKSRVERDFHRKGLWGFMSEFSDDWRHRRLNGKI